ncbi:hypothetical protein [Hyphobacterium marinum]|uniref:Uncharacterized protein n=1 Tax=Hyphobacterium marinum TaxID=3116574 RepID=A0ABU7LYX8_9PROT|nr:hypothetical protein [Hyphobacterium sp. Y6023]MEE2566395.1 hypothetical protein [Hyphobacterium sp. Y6023]
MILSRISKAIREQNWFAVAIEFVIVVLGVVIGFQISAWNEQRGEASREQAYIGFLIEDFEADHAEFSAIRRTAEGRNAVLHLVLTEATGEPPSDRFVSPEGEILLPAAGRAELPDDLSLIYSITFLRTIDGNRHAYTSLVSTGDNRIIADSALIRDIQRFYAEVDEFRDLEATILNNRDNMMNSLRALGISRQTPIEVGALAAQVREHPALRAQMQDFYLYSLRQGERVREFEDRSGALVTRLREAAP